MAVATTQAAHSWFGYGNWSAPYWFVGMEPGGEEQHASYESWLRLGGGELIDCRLHHKDSGFTRWHSDRPPTQATWRRLIQLVLSFEQKCTDMETVRIYQRDHFGRIGDVTAVIELLALHARATSVPVTRDEYRRERIETLRSRVRENHPRFAVFYGHGNRKYYEQVIESEFCDDDSALILDGTRRTLCALAPHPTSHGLKKEYWTALGSRLRERLNGDPVSMPDYRD